MCVLTYACTYVHVCRSVCVCVCVCVKHVHIYIYGTVSAKMSPFYNIIKL